MRLAISSSSSLLQRLLLLALTLALLLAPTGASLADQSDDVGKQENLPNDTATVSSSNTATAAGKTQTPAVEATEEAQPAPAEPVETPTGGAAQDAAADEEVAAVQDDADVTAGQDQADVTAGEDDADVTAGQDQADVTAGQDDQAVSGQSANEPGPYTPDPDNNTVGDPSQNGRGGGNATGRPCQGCVGNADDKNPPGQLPNADEDGNQGYECDGNQGVGKGNPAHSQCPEPAQLVLNPDISLVKGGPATAQEGDKIRYTFDVRNTGDVLLTNVHIVDPRLGITDLAVSPSSLDVGQEGQARATYTVSSDDAQDGFIDNVATVTGTAPDGEDVSATDDHHVDISPIVITGPNPGISLEKDGPATAREGDRITYTFAVRNTGDVTLTNVRISDEKLGLTDLAVTPSTLEPGQRGTATATYTITGEDADAGEAFNEATVTGTTPNGGSVTDIDDHIVEIPARPPTLEPGISLEKDGPATATEGERITYTFTVTNTGEVTLTDVSITDAKLGLTDLAVTPSTLEPGQTGTATATYTVRRPDVRRGFILNTAVVTGTTPDGGSVTDTDDHTTEIPPPPTVPPTEPPTEPPPTEPPPEPDLPATGTDAPVQFMVAMALLALGGLLIRRTTHGAAVTTGDAPVVLYLTGGPAT